MQTRNYTVTTPSKDEIRFTNVKMGVDAGQRLVLFRGEEIQVGDGWIDYGDILGVFANGSWTRCVADDHFRTKES